MLTLLIGTANFVPVESDREPVRLAEKVVSSSLLKAQTFLTEIFPALANSLHENVL